MFLWIDIVVVFFVGLCLFIIYNHYQSARVDEHYNEGKSAH